MSRAAFAASVVVALHAGAAAAAEGKTSVSAQARVGGRVLGTQRATGGVTIGASAHLLYPVATSDATSLLAFGGVTGEAIGIQSGWHWAGIVAGPEAGLRLRSGWYDGGIGVGVTYGQLPIVSEMGIPMRWWCLSPHLAVRPIGYRADDFSVALQIDPMYVVPGSGAFVSWGASLAGSFR